MFLLKDINVIHARVKSGADFPAYVHDIATLGVISYTFWTTDGHAVYRGKGGYRIEDTEKYPVREVASKGDRDALEKSLDIHQAGESDFATFLSEAIAAGVDHWTTDTDRMLCTYYDRSGGVILAEEIPA